MLIRFCAFRSFLMYNETMHVLSLSRALGFSIISKYLDIGVEILVY